MKKENSSPTNGIVNKWGEDTLSIGWTAIPIALIKFQNKLKISPVSMNILLHILSQWWQKENLPYPSQSSIAEKMGLSTRTVQRELLTMKKNGIINIKRTSISDPKFMGRNIYDLSLLVNKLQKLSIDHSKKNIDL